MATAIHGSRVPEVRAEILARRFHRERCRGCGTTIELRRKLLYTDLERGHWIVVAAPGASRRWRSAERELFDDVRRGFVEGSPLAEAVRPRRVRLVLSYEGLREKLVLWQAGLDDALVECCKARIVASDPRLAAPGSQLIVESVGDGEELVLAWWPAASATTPGRWVMMPISWVAQADRDRDTLQARFPELFGGGLVSLWRYLDVEAAEP